MVKDILNYFGYIVGELLPFDGRAHFEFLHYYFKYPLLSSDALLIIYSALFVGLCIYFIRDIFRIFYELFKSIKLLLVGRATIASVCTEFKMLNLMLVTLTATIVYYPVAMLASKYDFSLYLSCALMIVAAIALRLSEVFTRIKVDGKVFSVKETLVFTAVQSVSVIPGFSRIASMMALGKFMGSERKHLTNFVLISFIPLVFIQMLNVNSDWIYIGGLLFTNWKMFLIIAGMVVLSLDLIIMLLVSPSFYKFYYYIAGIAAWTILDQFFSKRGL
jgi:undecaprenyl pyrophosphate phosphatase UppP